MRRSPVPVAVALFRYRSKTRASNDGFARLLGLVSSMFSFQLYHLVASFKTFDSPAEALEGITLGVCSISFRSDQHIQ